MTARWYLLAALVAAREAAAWRWGAAELAPTATPAAAAAAPVPPAGPPVVAKVRAHEAQGHLDTAWKAFEKTKKNLQGAMKTGNNIEKVSLNIKDLYTPNWRPAKSDARGRAASCIA